MILKSLLQHLSQIDGDTRTLLLRFLVRAFKNPNPNRYIQDAMRRILDEEDGVRPSVQRR